jgi:hypothetical protein
MGSAEELQALHTSRLEFFFTQAIDTTVRGIIYEARGASQELLRGGEAIARTLAERNEIPMAFLDSDPDDHADWLADASAAVRLLLIGA